MLTRSLRWKLHSLLLRCVFLTLTLSVSAAVAAGGCTVSVRAPNGTDDTANIQSALDACVARGHLEMSGGRARVSIDRLR